MLTICSGWRDITGAKVHETEIVLVAEDGTGGPCSHGICPACKAAFLERADAAVAARRETR